RGARHWDALALERLLESVDRRVVGALGDGEVGKEGRAVLPLLDDLRRARRGDDKAVATAAQHLLYVLAAQEAGRHQLPHARRLLPLAWWLELRIAARGAATLLVGDFVVDPHSWSLGLSCRALASGLLLLLQRRGGAGLDARHLRLLAARAEHGLLELRILVL